jgi:hypothetical protein
MSSIRIKFIQSNNVSNDNGWQNADSYHYIKVLSQ